MWLIRYIRSTKITYEQISEFICHDCREYLIEQEYGIIAKPSTLGDPNPNAILEQIYQFLGNLLHTYNIKESYLEMDEPWSGILVAT